MNGMGKTNLLDAIYYLSFCKSQSNPIDSQNIRHGAEFFVVQGFYEQDDGTKEEIYSGLKIHSKKSFKRNKKEYTRLADHIGFIPLVMVSPSDSELISGGSSERRRFMDVSISQFDKEYLNSLIRYNQALTQRNALLRNEMMVDDSLYDVLEQQMAEEGQIVFSKREAYVNDFNPLFRQFYSSISSDREVVELMYQSHAQEGDLLNKIRQSRERDRIVGFSLCGIHKDDLEMRIGGFPIKREGSQGQSKSYLVALKLAQFNYLKKMRQTVPLLLLDDIFDKLDRSRVEQIVKLVSEDNFGQIFITDTERNRFTDILPQLGSDYKVFMVDNGQIDEAEGER
jgi:DNA replication and repair protein RecF